MQQRMQQRGMRQRIQPQAIPQGIRTFDRNFNSSPVRPEALRRKSFFE
jgi:hypothetical protein